MEQVDNPVNPRLYGTAPFDTGREMIGRLFLQRRNDAAALLILPRMRTARMERTPRRRHRDQLTGATSTPSTHSVSRVLEPVPSLPP